MTYIKAHLKPAAQSHKSHELYRNEGKGIKAMSISELQASGHFQDWTEDELVTMMDTVRTFTEIVYSAWSRQGQDSEQKTSIIPLSHQQRKAA